MLPYITIGQLKIPTYYSAMILGFALTIVLMLLKPRRERYNLSCFQSIVFSTTELICGILGCKLLFVLENMDWVKKNGFTFGGFSFYGAVFLIPLIMPLICKLIKINLRDSLDNSAICIIAMLGAIRFGCFLNGCCGGRVFHIGDFYFTLPVQLIESAYDFIVLFMLLKYEKERVACGFLYPRLLLFYGSARFFIEFLRSTSKDWLYLSHAQWFSIIAVIIGIVFEIIFRKQKTYGNSSVESYQKTLKSPLD